MKGIICTYRVCLYYIIQLQYKDNPGHYYNCHHLRFSKVLEMIVGYYCTTGCCPLKIVVINIPRAFESTHQLSGLCSALPTCIIK